MSIQETFCSSSSAMQGHINPAFFGQNAIHIEKTTDDDGTELVVLFKPTLFLIAAGIFPPAAVTRDSSVLTVHDTGIEDDEDNEPRLPCVSIELQNIVIKYMQRIRRPITRRDIVSATGMKVTTCKHATRELTSRGIVECHCKTTGNEYSLVKTNVG